MDLTGKPVADKFYPDVTGIVHRHLSPARVEVFWSNEDNDGGHPSEEYVTDLVVLTPDGGRA